MKTFHMRRAMARDLPIIVGLIEEAAEWLRTKDTDQWARPWPTAELREQRVLAALVRGNTWLAWDHGIPAATITVEETAGDTANPKLWTEKEAAEPALYVNRLVVSRRYAGIGLGAALLNWAGTRARREYGARWIRIDVWTTNDALHKYYQRKGFVWVRYCSDPTYPSGALLQRCAADERDGSGIELVTDPRSTANRDPEPLARCDVTPGPAGWARAADDRRPVAVAGPDLAGQILLY
jgi:GNAT superfamily N-acetyltransferase